jgi:hypothetical protein
MGSENQKSPEKSDTISSDRHVRAWFPLDCKPAPPQMFSSTHLGIGPLSVLDCIRPPIRARRPQMCRAQRRRSIPRPIRSGGGGGQYPTRDAFPPTPCGPSEMSENINQLGHKLSGLILTAAEQEAAATLHPKPNDRRVTLRLWCPCRRGFRKSSSPRDPEAVVCRRAVRRNGVGGRSRLIDTS